MYKFNKILLEPLSLYFKEKNEGKIKIVKKGNLNKYVVAFVCTSLNKVAGGLERQLVRVANELSKSEFKVLILSYDNHPSLSFYDILDNVYG